MLFPKCTKVVFAADGSGEIKARLQPGVAARDVRRKKARKISDNLVQYHTVWAKPQVTLKTDEIVLLGTVSRFTKQKGWLIANRDTIEAIHSQNRRAVRRALPNLLF